MHGIIGDLLARDKPATPIAIWPYIDKIAFWTARSFTDNETAYIKAECGPGGTDIDRLPHKARFDPRLIQRIETRQPSDDLLKFLSAVDGLLINMAEFALDLIFDSEDARDRAYEFIDRHFVKKGHRGDVRYFKQTRYTDRRWAPTNFVVYRPAFAKLTGELYCLHIEWRVCGVAALRRMEINGIKDLIEFDHRAHWESRLRLRTFDFARLGRAYSNGLRKRRKDTPRKPRIYVTRSGFEYHTDKRLGQLLLRIAETVQGVIDFANKREISVSRCLTEIENDALLPKGVKI
jgi:hypothetical protein